MRPSPSTWIRRSPHCWHSGLLLFYVFGFWKLRIPETDSRACVTISAMIWAATSRLLRAAAISAVIAVAVLLSFSRAPCFSPKRSIVDPHVYMLDGNSLYPGPGYRGFIEARYIVRSYQDLLSRVAVLPTGTALFYSTPRGVPAWSRLQLIRLKWLCHTHKIEFIDVNAPTPVCR